ncbi:MAG: WG repeat-containing protein [Alistipes sp.]|nr:WG repeat-containing protein [Alistipes sp.]
MIPTMTYFEQALSAPSIHFCRLRQIEPIRHNDRPIIRRTHSTIESEILWNDRHYLIALPFKSESIRHIEDLEEELRNRRQGPLINCQILYNELTLTDSVGRKSTYDIVLQEIPSGMMLEEAVQHYKAADLRRGVELMKERLDAIGFCHNNLRPSNIVVCSSGVIRPLRYWYAKWEDYSDNNISQLSELIAQHDLPEGEASKLPLITTAENECSDRKFHHSGVIRAFRCGRYGFLDDDGRQITQFIYTWASEFCEGRAIVARNNKMGAIDGNGKKVIPVTYDSLEFDIEQGVFYGTHNGHNHLIDYDGKRIHTKNKKV